MSTQEPTDEELLQTLQAFVAQYRFAAQAARALDVSDTQLNMLLAGRVKIRDSKVLPRLGYRRVVTVVPADPEQPTT